MPQSFVRLLPNCAAIQTIVANFKNSDGWMVKGPIFSQLRLPATSFPRGVTTAHCRATPAAKIQLAARRNTPAGRKTATAPTARPIAAYISWPLAVVKAKASPLIRAFLMAAGAVAE